MCSSDMSWRRAWKIVSTLPATLAPSSCTSSGSPRNGAISLARVLFTALLTALCRAIKLSSTTAEAACAAGLERHGLRWRWPEVDCAHPLDGGDAGLLHRSVADTAAGLGADGARWQRLFGAPSAGFDALAADIMGPLLRIPSHPFALARFGAPTVLPASALARIFRTRTARAMFGGVAAHAFQPLHRPLNSAIGLGIITAGHRHGWPVAEGGSQALTDALAAVLLELGVKVQTGVRVGSLAQLPPADVTMFDLTPTAIVDILGDRLPNRVRREFGRFRYGPGAFKVDFAVEGGVPWSNEAVGTAGTVHLGGDFAEVAETERDIHVGRMPQRPFVLVGQQYLADPGRSVGNVHPIFSYAHVPAGYSGDATEAIIAQFERFAPGFRDRVVGMHVRSTTELSVYNPNYVGGDICTGAKDVRQLVFGPRFTLQPYRIGVPGMYICSAATPPGPGAHGMCGANAAAAALDQL